jgi:2-isopropylmalate synthase
VPPETVGNQRNILVSDQAGRSNLLARFDEIGLNIDPKHPKIPQVLDRVKEAEGKGYSYDGAEASFELLARQILETVPAYYDLQSYRVIDERRFNAKGALVTQSEASLRVAVNGTAYFEVAEGDGPVDALNKALRKVLEKVYPALGELQLADYKVRILSPDLATAAITRVIMECSDASGHRWSTVGVDKDVINASYNALHDSITYMLLKHGVPSLHC